jgi:hypothetical protein
MHLVAAGLAIQERGVSKELTDDVYRLGQDILAAEESSAPTTLNAALSHLVGPAFHVRPGVIVDYDSSKTERFCAVVHQAKDGNDVTDALPADNVAAVVDYVDEMDVETLRAACHRIAAAKRLRKHAIPRPPDSTNVTLGLIFARSSKVSLEVLAAELYRLNTQMPQRHWPDMVAVASMGIVNYAGQYPGEMPSGDYLPAVAPSFEHGPAPVYIVVIMRPIALYTFNRMAAILIAHLRAFAPERLADLPDWNDLLDNVNPNAVTTSGFQFNLQRRLVPTPRAMHNDRYIPRHPVTIEDKTGTALATVEYLKWQDGGVILLVGKLSLNQLLAYLRVPGLRHAGTIARQHYQFTNVLPIARRDFQAFLNNIGKHSPYVVNTKSEGTTIQKIFDEGVQTPFVARCWLGLLRIREHVHPDTAARQHFDEVLENVRSQLISARTSSRQIATLWIGHAAQISSGEIVRIEGSDLTILKSVDKALSSEVEAFVNIATRTIKNGMQTLANQLGIDFGFLFKKQSAFDAGVATMRQTDLALADYLQEARNWTEQLVTIRNSLEHGLWSLPRIGYTRTDASVAATEPMVLQMPVTKFADYFYNRVACFVEEVTAHCLQRRILDGVTLTELPPADRLAEAPERFRVTPAVGGDPRWTITHHLKMFDEV